MIAATNIFEWIMGKLPVVIFLVIFVGQIVRGFLRSRRDTPPPVAKPDELEEQRRVREIQEQIRRRIAERRGDTSAQPASRSEPSEPVSHPVPRRIETTQMPEPFGGPLRRVFEEIQREMQPQAAPSAAPPPMPINVERRNAELERQEQLNEKLRVLEESRVLVQRRAAQLAAGTYAQSQSETGLRSVARVKLLEELHDVASLRRAFVLREVLGPPVGLR